MVEDNSKEVKNHGKGEEKLVSNGVLEQLPMKELVRIYNGTHPPSHVKGSFDSVAQGVRMILERLVFLKRKPPSIRPKKGKHGKRKRLDLPRCAPMTDGVVMEYDLKLDTVLALLRWGVDCDTMMKIMKWKKREQYLNYLRKINKFTGYAIREDSKYVARLIEG